MINKINKNIHNKYLKFFKFLFYLRYLFVIFFVTTSLFFLIPKYFDYEKKQDLIKEHLLKDYNLELIDYKFIEFNVFPLPNLAIKEVSFKIKEQPFRFKSQNLNIILKLKDIYGYKNFKSKKIIFNENDISLDITEIKRLFKYFKDLKSKLDIKNLNLNLKKNDIPLSQIKNINFSNYGYNKYFFTGEIFEKKFEIFFKENNKLKIEILDTGIEADFLYKKNNLKNLITGSSKVNILKNFLKFDFNLDSSQLEIIKSNFRSKLLSINFNSVIKYNPYFGIESVININKIDKFLFKNTSLEEILQKNKKIIKKINSVNQINYKAKKYNNDLVKSFTLNTKLAYGRLDFTNKILTSGADIICEGDSIITDQYPRLNFVCSVKIHDTKKLFKKLSIPKNIKKDPFDVDVEGSLNIYNKKINFNKIKLKDDYLANKEDKQYFKDMFEKILYDEDFFNIFKIDKIKSFFIAVI